MSLSPICNGWQTVAILRMKPLKPVASTLRTASGAQPASNAPSASVNTDAYLRYCAMTGSCERGTCILLLLFVTLLRMAPKHWPPGGRSRERSWHQAAIVQKEAAIEPGPDECPDHDQCEYTRAEADPDS